MEFIHKLGAIIWKDFISEFRTKEMILSMCLFSFLVLIIFNFAFGSSPNFDREMIAGILWVAFVFSGLTGFGRSFSMERDRGTLQGLILCPVSPWTIFLAKLIGVFLFTTVMEIITIFIFTILYNTTVLPFLVPLGLIAFLGTLSQKCPSANSLFSDFGSRDYCFGKGNRDNLKRKISSNGIPMAENPGRF
jgi:heme exporter protein B